MPVGRGNGRSVSMLVGKGKGKEKPVPMLVGMGKGRLVPVGRGKGKPVPVGMGKEKLVSVGMGKEKLASVGIEGRPIVSVGSPSNWESVSTGTFGGSIEWSSARWARGRPETIARVERVTRIAVERIVTSRIVG